MCVLMSFVICLKSICVHAEKLLVCVCIFFLISLFVIGNANGFVVLYGFAKVQRIKKTVRYESSDKIKTMRRVQQTGNMCVHFCTSFVIVVVGRCSIAFVVVAVVIVIFRLLFSLDSIFAI